MILWLLFRFYHWLFLLYLFPFRYTVLSKIERGDIMDLQDILTKEEYTVYTAYCVQGRKLWEIVDDTGLTINQVLNRIKTARRKIIAAYNLKGVEK